MNKYYLKILTYTHVYETTIYAKHFHTTTNNSTTSGFYSFYDENNLVACYPIDKTIIESIEKIDTEN
jgi:hypothetical protein